MSEVVVLRCCEPVYRDHPSRVRKYHAKTCPVKPGMEIVKPRRAETASHAARTEAEAYEEAWSDLAYELREGK